MRVSLSTRLSKFVRMTSVAALCGVLLSGAAINVFAGTATPEPETPAETPTPVPTPVNPPPSGSNPPAARYYGAVTAQGQTASDGTNVTATADTGATCGSVNVGDPPASDGNYVLDDTGSDPDCSTPGSELTFSVGGETATTSDDPAVPDANGAIHIDLTAP